MERAPSHQGFVTREQIVDVMQSQPDCQHVLPVPDKLIDMLAKSQDGTLAQDGHWLRLSAVKSSDLPTYSAVRWAFEKH